MFRTRNRGFLGFGFRDPKDKQPDSRRNGLIGLAIALLLVALGVYLAHVLRETSQLQDCLMSGRTNCEPIKHENVTEH